MYHVISIAIVLQLTSVVIIIMGLCKLQGHVVTHYEKVVWWKSFMVDFEMCNPFQHKNILKKGYTFQIHNDTFPPYKFFYSILYCESPMKKDAFDSIRPYAYMAI